MRAGSVTIPGRNRRRDNKWQFSTVVQDSTNRGAAPSKLWYDGEIGSGTTKESAIELGACEIDVAEVPPRHICLCKKTITWRFLTVSSKVLREVFCDHSRRFLADHPCRGAIP
eukprot:gene22380-biopygen7968